VPLPASSLTGDSPTPCILELLLLTFYCFLDGLEYDILIYSSTPDGLELFFTPFTLAVPLLSAFVDYLIIIAVE